MCHLCQKLEGLKELDSKAIKPISALLSRLHRKIEPQLGDLWLERYDQAVKLHRLVAKLYEAVPVKPLEVILDYVKCELRHIQKNMRDHPPQLSTGRLNTLKGSISPSSSASCEVVRRNQRQAEQSIHISRGVRRQMGGSGRRRAVPARRAVSKVTLKESDLPELPGSDLDPPSERVQHSIRVVEDWFERCEGAPDNEWAQSRRLVQSETTIPATIDRSKDMRSRDRNMYIRSWEEQ